MFSELDHNGQEVIICMCMWCVDQLHLWSFNACQQKEEATKCSIQFLVVLCQTSFQNAPTITCIMMWWVVLHLNLLLLHFECVNYLHVQKLQFSWHQMLTIYKCDICWLCHRCAITSDSKIFRECDCHNNIIKTKNCKREEEVSFSIQYWHRCLLKFIPCSLTKITPFRNK